MKVLVTGANGFLGSHIVSKLIKEGHKVKAFILDGTDEDNLKGLDYEVYRGNLLNEDDVDEALDTCEYLIHTAAITDVWPTKNKLSWKINYDVVKILSKLVKQKSIKKFIHVGTANSFGYGSLSEPGTEETEYNGDKYGLDYISSKKAAQDFLLEESKNGLPVVIINPTFMIGENDSKPGPGELIISVIKGKMPGCPVGGRCYASVKDVASACVNAIDKGKIGECYITGGANLSYKKFYALIGKIANVKPPKIIIPTFITCSLAIVVEFFAKLRKRKPKFTYSVAKISKDGHFYSSKKAIQELDYPQTSLEIALTEAIEWYKNNGYIK